MLQEVCKTGQKDPAFRMISKNCRSKLVVSGSPLQTGRCRRRHSRSGEIEIVSLGICEVDEQLQDGMSDVVRSTHSGELRAAQR
jgi:hypothetical protein